MNDLRKAIWEAIKNWDINTPEYSGYCKANGSHVETIFNAVKALAQPEQEPGLDADIDMAYNAIDRFLRNHLDDDDYAELSNYLEKIYTAPQKHEWVGLTDEQRAVLNFMLGADELDGVLFGDRHPKETGSFWWRNRLRNAFQDVDIEAKLKEKNT